MFRGSTLFENGALKSPANNKKKPELKENTVKSRILAGVTAAILLAGGTTLTLLAQNGPGARGYGYGGPPKSAEERAVRQAACAQQCDRQCSRPGQCLGPCATGQLRGQGWRGGRNGTNWTGRGYRRGLRDGTGPRSANGTCPLAKPATDKK